MATVSQGDDPGWVVLADDFEGLGELGEDDLFGFDPISQLQAGVVHGDRRGRGRALVGGQDGEVLELVCRANLDVHLGTAGRYGERFGNLGTDGAPMVFGRALAHGARTADALWFGPDPQPQLAELATRHGDQTGQGVHFSADSIRYLWLDRARRPQSTVNRG